MKKNSIIKFAVAGLAALALAAGLLLRAVGPSPVVMVVASSSGRGLMSARGAAGLAEPGNISDMPALALMFARLRPTRIEWRMVDAPGAAPKAARGLSLDGGGESAPQPVWDGGEKIFVAGRGGRLALLKPDGATAAEHVFTGGQIRDLSISRDGGMVAVSVISPRKGFARSPFRLFAADSGLKSVVEVETDGLYPMLTPGAVEWGADGMLYFSGFDREDHKLRHTYRGDPATGKVSVAGGDWGPMFSISPDGAIAASVEWRGLVLTNTTSGAEVVAGTAGLRPVATKPGWSTDGKRVAFMLNSRPGSKGAKAAGPRVMVADLAGANFSVTGKPLPDFNCGSCAPVWTPDGRYVLFNGYSFESRSFAAAVRRVKTLAFDSRSGEVSFPEYPDSLWK